MLRPCYSVKEVAYLIGVCNTLDELRILASVLLDDRKRYQSNSFVYLMELLNSKINNVLGFSEL